MRRRNFPKGYAEMLEKQHNQLVGGLQEMYQRLQKASLWEGEPLDESSGRPLTHDILAALNFLEPTEDDFIEQPESSPMLEEAVDEIEDASAASSQDIVTQQTPPMFGEPALSVQTTTTRSPSVVLSPSTPGPNQLPGQSNMEQQDSQRQPKQIFPVVSPPMQFDTLWNDPLYSFDTSQMPMMSSNSTDNNDWCFQAPAMLPPLLTQLPNFRNENLSGHKRTASLPRPALCHGWLGNGVGFDSSDFMSDFHQLSPQDMTDIGLRQARKSGSLS
jgi:hypothetical protein